jgi:single-stranded DNA-binding protein
VVAWGDLAEYIAEFRKGDEVYVLGMLTQEEIERAGKKESKTRVRAHIIRPVRKRSGGGTDPSAQQRDTAERWEAPPF